MGANGLVQLMNDQPFDWGSFGIAGLIGAMSSGKTLAPVLLTSTGGALTSSAINGQNPNAAMAGAAIGSTAGYSIGTKIDSSLGSVLNPWYRQEWKEIGMGISTYVPKNPLPSWTGNIVGGGIQELTGSTTQAGLEGKK